MKNKRKIISIIAALLCVCIVVCATGCSNGLTDTLKDFIYDDTETQGGSNYVPDKKPVLVNPNDTSSGDGSSTGDSSSTDNGTSGGGLVSYKEVLNQDSDEIRVDYILDIEHNYTFYGIFTDALLPNTEYLIEWSLQKDGYPYDENLDVFYDSLSGEYLVSYYTDYKGYSESSGWFLEVESEKDNIPVSFLQNSFTFRSGLEGNTFAFLLLSSVGCDQTHAEKCVDLIYDNLLLRISKVE